MVEGFDENNVLLEEVMECGLNMLWVIVESLCGFEFDFVCIVVIYILCKVVNVWDFIN